MKGIAWITGQVLILSLIILSPLGVACTEASEYEDAALSSSELSGRAGASSLSDSEADQMTFIREEEKLARDVYLELGERWGTNVFGNISESEQRHMDAIGNLLASYGLPDPIVSDQLGLFTNTDLQALYNELVERGGQSLEDALLVGQFIEEYDILDLQHAIDATTHSDIAAVYENLLCGSRNHLRAFTRQLGYNDLVVEADLMEQTAFEAIIESQNERCGRGGQGVRGGRGGSQGGGGRGGQGMGR